MSTTTTLATSNTAELETSTSTVAKWLDTWLTGLASTTARAYTKDLAKFAEHHGYGDTATMATELIAAGHATAADALNRWKAAMIAAELAPSTINRRLSAVRSMVRHAHEGALISWVVTTKGVKSKVYRDTRGPGVPAVGRMVEALSSTDTPKAARDLALVRLMFDAGLRRGEVVALDLVDVDVERCTVLVIGKGHTEREPITVADRTCEAIVAWVEHRGNKPGPLFINLDRAGKGGRLTGRSVARIVNALGITVGAGHVTPHGLRHTAITAALDESNGNTRAAQRFSRHADARTLNVYDDARTDMAGQLTRTIAELV